MKRLPTIILIAMLTFVSTWYVNRQVIHRHVETRPEHAYKILSGQMEPPYQYRVLKPLAGQGLDSLLSPLIADGALRHEIAYSLLTLAAFAITYSLLYLILRRSFSQLASYIGILFLQAIVPLSVTGFYMEGDFYTLAFYTLGLALMIYGKDVYLPLVIGLATFNREQMIFLVFLYAIYLFSRRELRGKKLLILLSCAAVWLAVFMSTRLYFGFKPTRYTPAVHLIRNTDVTRLLQVIIPLWIAEVAPSVALCALAFRKSNRFFRLSFLSLGIYTVLFFFNGNMWELAKFLPAFLIMIPMGLQTLTGEYVDQL